MMHKNRRWCVSTVGTADELAQMLTERTWTLCSGFMVAGHEEYLFLNDATHEDGAAEFGIVKGGMAGPHTQLESVTFSWCNPAEALNYIRQALAGAMDKSEFARHVQLQLDKPEEHGRCHRCM
jgi:hypothetical protein